MAYSFVPVESVSNCTRVVLLVNNKQLRLDASIAAQCTTSDDDDDEQAHTAYTHNKDGKGNSILGLLHARA